MHRSSAKALSGVAALFLGFGSMSVAIHRHAHAGSPQHRSVLTAASVPSASTAGEDRAAEVAARDEQDALAATEAHAEAERQAESDRIAAEADESVRKAAAALRVTVTTVRPPVVATAPVSAASGCNSIPAYVVARESGCRNIPNAGGSGCDGYYQICKATWDNYGGYPDAMSAPKAVQDAKAAALYDNGRGCQHWNAC